MNKYNALHHSFDPNVFSRQERKQHDDAEECFMDEGLFCLGCSLRQVTVWRAFA